MNSNSRHRLPPELALLGKTLPAHAHREFEAQRNCGRLEHGSLRVRCDKCHFERALAFACKKGGLSGNGDARKMA